MFLGIALSFRGWLTAFGIAIFLVLLPMLAGGIMIESLHLQEPLQSILNVLFCFILMPTLVSYAYFRKINSGKISAITSAVFWTYCCFYIFLFVVFGFLLFSREISFNDILGQIVLGIVSISMVTVGYKAKTKQKELLAAQNVAYQKEMEQQQEKEREEYVKMQAEAILLAEKMKKEQ